MEQCRLGLDTDPLSMILHYAMARSMYYAKQYRESVEYARKALEMDPNYYLLWFAMGLLSFTMAVPCRRLPAWNELWTLRLGGIKGLGIWPRPTTRLATASEARNVHASSLNRTRQLRGCGLLRHHR